MGTYHALACRRRREQFELENIKIGLDLHPFRICLMAAMGLLANGPWRGELIELCSDAEEGGLWDQIKDEDWPDVQGIEEIRMQVQSALESLATTKWMTEKTR